MRRRTKLCRTIVSGLICRHRKILRPERIQLMRKSFSLEGRIVSPVLSHLKFRSVSGGVATHLEEVQNCADASTVMWRRERKYQLQPKSLNLIFSPTRISFGIHTTEFQLRVNSLLCAETRVSKDTTQSDTNALQARKTLELAVIVIQVRQYSPLDAYSSHNTPVA